MHCYSPCFFGESVAGRNPFSNSRILFVRNAFHLSRLWNKPPNGLSQKHPSHDSSGCCPTCSAVGGAPTEGTNIKGFNTGMLSTCHHLHPLPPHLERCDLNRPEQTQRPQQVGQGDPTRKPLMPHRAEHILEMNGKQNSTHLPHDVLRKSTLPCVPTVCPQSSQSMGIETFRHVQRTTLCTRPWHLSR